MKRDPRLHGLTSDHHHALLLAWRVRTACEGGQAPGPDLAAEVSAAYEAQLNPHFVVEEKVLLPALAAAGETPLVERTLAEHARLRALVAMAAHGETGGLREFAALLHDHVRFEEAQLFPVCEARLPAAVLEEAWRRAPKDDAAR